MKSFYSCSFFEEQYNETRDFKVYQDELVFKNLLASGQCRFAKERVEYVCFWNKQKDFDHSKPTIILPIRDNLQLLKITLKNFQENRLTSYCNVIVVDDRSEEPIDKLVLKNNLSYLRVDNQRGFNFSMLNNIASKICHSLGVQTVLFWNADLWCAKEEWFVEVLSRHHDHSSSVSGTKLLYPPLHLSLNKEEDTININKHFSSMAGHWRETIQFGGISWVISNGPIRTSPVHHRRFATNDDHQANADKPQSAVTGALQIWNLNDFINLGGFNPSMANVFQDIDICLRALESGKKVYYFGKDIYFYHDESAVHENTKGHNKTNHQFQSDHVLFGKIWNDKIQGLVM